MPEYSQTYEKLKKNNPNKQIVGFTAGNFDLIHYGYTVTFEEAKRHCDRFVVFLQKDPSLTRFTKYKPVMSCYERYKNLMSIKYIDEVYMYQTEEELLELIKFIDPDVRVLGEDYIDNPFTGDDLDIEVIYTTRSHEWSTTKLKNRIAAMTIIQNPEILNAIKIKEIKAGDFSSIEN
jgi:glycerol-3-phosphate cytidylyltransferase